MIIIYEYYPFRILMKFFSGFFFAKSIVYSPLPQPSSTTIGWVFLKKECHFPFIEKLFKTSSLVG